MNKRSHKIKTWIGVLVHVYINCPLPPSPPHLLSEEGRLFVDQGLFCNSVHVQHILPRLATVSFRCLDPYRLQNVWLCPIFWMLILRLERCTWKEGWHGGINLRAVFTLGHFYTRYIMLLWFQTGQVVNILSSPGWGPGLTPRRRHLRQFCGLQGFNFSLSNIYQFLTLNCIV